MLALLLALTAFAGDLRVAVATGDCAALRALDAETLATDGARLAEARCRLRDDDPAGALTVSEGLTVAPFTDYGRLVRAEAHLRRDDTAAALRELVGLSLPGDAGLTVQLLRGRALVDADRSLEARDDLRALLDSPVGDEARYTLALGGERRGDVDAAIATYRRTWIDSVRGPWSERAAERLAALGAPVPDTSSEEGRALVAQRVDALTAANRHDEALALSRTLPDTGDTLGLARRLFLARDYRGAVATWARALGPPATASGPAAALFDYALATSRTGDYDTAAVIYRRVMAEHPGTDRADEASYKLGYLAYDRGSCDKAREEFGRHLREHPRSGHADSAGWFTARCAWIAGDRAAAVAGWQTLLAERASSPLAPGARYWIAIAAGLDGDPAAERDGLEEVLRRWPTNGYAWFAAERLGRRFPARSTPTRPPWSAAWADDPRVQRFERLLAAGFQPWARGELEALLRARHPEGRDESLAAAHAAIAAGAYRTGQRLARSWCVSPWEDGDRLAQTACLPRPEAELVRRTAERWHLPALLPYAIMTAESALDPEVTSIAGARGLMQIMPVEGPELHALAFDGGTFHPDNLYSAPYNAVIGTTELGRKARALGDLLVGDDTPTVIAAYNGGEEAVRRWVSSFDSPPAPDAFAEAIDFTETRRYVRAVLGHWMAYRWLYGDSAEP